MSSLIRGGKEMKNGMLKHVLSAALVFAMATTTVSNLPFGAMHVYAAEEETTNSIVGKDIGGTEETDSLTIQPGETTEQINLNWYAPAGTTHAVVMFGDKEYVADIRDLQTPTQLNENKYTDTGKKVCTVTIDGLMPNTKYCYQISNDGGENWSESHIYATPERDSFVFGFTSDPQIKENKSINDKGWNSSDGTNQTGWAVMMEKLASEGVNLIVSAGDQVEDQSWGKSSEYEAFFAPEEMAEIAYAPAVGNHDRHYMFDDHFNLPNEMEIAEDGANAEADKLAQIKTTFRGQNSGSSQSHGNYIQATEEEIANSSASNGITPNENGTYDFAERREMETKGNYYYLYNNVLFVTLNTGAYPGGNDSLEGENNSGSSLKDNAEAEAIVANFKTTLASATKEYEGKYDWIVVSHHKSTQTVAKHVADSDIENYVDAGFEKLMDEFDVDFVLGGHDHVYSRSYVLKDGQRNSERLDNINDPDGTIYLTGNCCSDMQYYTPFDSVDKVNNVDYPLLANGQMGSAAYMEGVLPVGNQEWNQEYSPSYAIFEVEGNTISVNVYNLDGDSIEPSSKKVDNFTVTKNTNGGAAVHGVKNGNSTLNMTQIARYVSGITDADGGVLEIVDYNSETGWAYAVNGKTGNLTAIAIKDMQKKDTIDLLDGNDIDIKSLVTDENFVYGDMTSISISPDGKILAVAIQAEGYADKGRVALFTCNIDGTLTFIKTVEVGVQPDMVTFTEEGNKILTANEGEPRNGYAEGAIDPMGTVTIISLSKENGTVTADAVDVDFTAFDSEIERSKLVKGNVVLKKDTAPSVDFEPEYIAISDKRAYVALQEANAIAVLDIENCKFTDIYSAGFEDYSKVAVDIDKKDKTYNPKTYVSLMGIRMPDGISVYNVDGVDYLLTANEGDSREWGNYLNEVEVDFGNEGEASLTNAITAENSGLSGKVVFFNTKDYEGLDVTKDYLFGGRSFTIYKVNENGIEEVFDSGEDFEKITAEVYKDNFNCSNDDRTIDDRSGKKGPEPENVTIGEIDGNVYAFVVLERIGGIMAYDITNPTDSKYVNYINSRNFSADIYGDVSPEGLKFTTVNGTPIVMAACEVSGTLGVYMLAKQTVVENEIDKEQDKEQDKNSVIEHMHTVTTKVTPASLTADGKIETICSVCNEISTVQTISKINTVDLVKTSYTYNGKTKKPAIEVKDAAGNVLKENEDYIVSYPSGCKKVGEYKVSITFKGNYTGMVLREFKIIPKSTTISKVKAGSKGFTVKWKKQNKQMKGYEVSYSTNKKFTNKKTVIKKVSSKKTSLKVSKLKAKKTYYVRVRIFQNTKSGKIYSAWSEVKKVTTKK